MIFRPVLLSIAILLCVSCGANDLSTDTTLQYPASDSPSALLYVKKCSQCHAAPLPTVHDASVWPGVLQRMQMNMTQKSVPPLSKDELATILDYLQANAKR